MGRPVSPAGRFVFTIEGFHPDYAVHPGETLRELLDEAGGSQADLARRMGVSAKHVNQIIKGRTGIGPHVALLLERETKVSALFWARMQAAFDIHAARLSEDPTPALQVPE